MEELIKLKQELDSDVLRIRNEIDKAVEDLRKTTKEIFND